MTTEAALAKKAGPDKAAVVLFTILAFGMYYSRESNFSFAGIGFPYRHLWAGAIIVLSLCIFLVKTDLDRAAKLGKACALMCLPHLCTLFFSIPPWIVHFYDVSVIRRGFFNEVYLITVILAVTGMLYVLGESAIWCNLVGMILPNLIIMIDAVRRSSLSQYMSELRTAIVTFAGDVGPVISEMEVHELTFSLGVYVIFLIVEWKRMRKRPVALALLIAAAFFFLSGFKRIGIFAVAAAAAVYLAAEFWTRGGKRGRRFLVWVSVAACAVMLVYVALTTFGLLDFLQNDMGIELMGRGHFLDIVRPYFSFGPNYIGRGAGFTLELMYAARGTGLHNDILTQYIDAGFWGFLFWMVFYLPVRMHYITKWQGNQGGILSFAYQVYLLATALTDNTMHYTFVIGTLTLLTMAKMFQEDPAPALAHASAPTLGHKEDKPWRKL